MTKAELIDRFEQFERIYRNEAARLKAVDPVGSAVASRVRDAWAEAWENASLLEESTEQEQPQDDQRLDSVRYAHLPMIQKGKDGMFCPCPMPVQQEPSPLEVALRLYTKPDCGLTFDECVKAAFMIVDAVRAEEARRAGK